MKHQAISFGQTGAFNSFFLDYIGDREALHPFYNRFPDIKNFKEQIQEKQKSFKPETRKLLADTLQKQYKDINLSTAAANNLRSLLSENTFTVVTGHQLNIFTGPLYFIYKIVTAINSCRELKKAYPEYNFVPVYWMASEDHDFEEISYFKLNGKKFVWQTQQQGPVGRFQLKELKQLLSEIPGGLEPFKTAYEKSQNLADAVRHYVDQLFGAEGLIVVDGDDRELKNVLKPVMHADLFEGVTRKLVEQTNQDLKKLGYEPQVFARDINFFYIEDQLRERIEKTGDQFTVMKSALAFGNEEMQQIVEKHPERLSPNVILRPLYQELILPNLAYIGGPAENIYWLQLKKIFEQFAVPFPILLPRNFALIVDAPEARLMKKAKLTPEQLFMDKQSLINLVTVKNSSKQLELETLKKHFGGSFEEIKSIATKIDTTLSKLVDAEAHRALLGLEKIEKKMLQAERRKQSDKIRQAENLKDKLFPNGSLQERTDNLLKFYQVDPAFISRLLKSFDPFDFRFNILEYEQTGAS